MRQAPIPILGGYYADEALPWSAQDVCNWLPTQAESAGGTQTSGMLKTPPGLKPHVEILGATAVRGTYNCEGKFFAVIGQTLYQFSNTQVAIPIGEISGLSRVQFSHNQIVNGNELLIVNGNSGYVYNTVTLTLTRITDSGYVGAINAVFIDGFLVQIEPKRRFAFNSAIASAMDYNTLDRFTSEASPDLLVTMAVSNNELVLMSETSTEFFYNSGAVNQPFRTKRISLQKGCASRYGAAVMDNTVYMFGNDGYFYRLDGYSWIRISNRPIEQMVRGMDWRNAFAFIWQDSGHSVCYWTFPAGFTIGYDASIGQWHRRASWGLNYWRPISMTFWNQEWYAGDSAEGKVWKLDWQYMLEGSDCFVSERVTQIVHDNMNRVGIPRIELLIDTGMPETVPVSFPEQPIGPTVSGNAPDGLLATAYDGFAYTITPGDAPITSVNIHAGALPAGLEMNSSGVINTDVPTAIGASSYVVRATDTNGLFFDHPDTINIASVSYATTVGGPNLLITDDPYDWTTTVATGVPLASGRVESRNGKVFCFSNNGSGDAAVSADGGSSWLLCSGLHVGAEDVVGIVWTSSEYIVAYDFLTDVYVSSDGLTFTSRPFAVDLQQTSSIIAVDDVVIVARTNSSNSRRSIDSGNTYSNCPLISSVQIWQMATNGMTIVASPDDSLRYSTDLGASWSSIATPVSGPPLGVAFGNGIFLMATALGNVAVSSNGITWTAKTPLGQTMGGMAPGNKRVEFDGSLFIVCGNVDIFTSPDGVVWTTRTSVSPVCVDSYRGGQ